MPFIPGYARMWATRALIAWWKLLQPAPYVRLVDFDGATRDCSIRWVVGQLRDVTDDNVDSDTVYAIRVATHKGTKIPDQDPNDRMTYARAAALTRQYLIDQGLWDDYPRDEPIYTRPYDPKPDLIRALTALYTVCTNFALNAGPGADIRDHGLTPEMLTQARRALEAAGWEEPTS